MPTNEREELLAIATLADDVETCRSSRLAKPSRRRSSASAMTTRGSVWLLANLRLYQSHYPPAPPHGPRFTLAAMAPGDDGRRLDRWLRRPFVTDRTYGGR